LYYLAPELSHSARKAEAAHARRSHEFEGGGVNALKGGGGQIRYNHSNLKKVGVHDPLSSYDGTAPAKLEH